MKRTLSFMIMALALLLTQCRKPEVKFPTPSATEGVTVSMTVTAGPGSKTDITAAGAITWSEGDKLYVGDGTHYVGYLTLQGTGGSARGTFTGEVTLTDASDGEKPFHFFYLGNVKDYSEELKKGISAAVEVSFATQTGLRENLGSCHVGYGSAKGTVAGSEVTGINVTLVSKVAIAYFSFTEAAGKGAYTGALTLSGEQIYNKMKVNFSDGDFSFNGTEGNIRLAGGQSERYVMLVPAGTGRKTLTFGGGASGTKILENGIEANKFYMIDDSAIDVEVRPFEFSVDDNTTVEFAPGNLWANATDAENPVFHFEDNQWDPNPTANGTWDADHVSYFFWSKTASVACAKEYADDGASTSDVFFTNAAETIANPNFHVNGETGDNAWRTLARSEWQYLLGSNELPSYRDPGLCQWSEVTFSEGSTVVSGLIIMPDEYDYNMTPLTDGTGTTSYKRWQSLESSGAVFLPAAVSNNSSSANYWSSTPQKKNIVNSYSMYATPYKWDADFCERGDGGHSVRLVK